MAVDGPEDFGAGGGGQAGQKQTAPQVLGLQDEIRLKIVLVEYPAQGDCAGFGRRIVQNLVPGLAQGIKEHRPVNQQDVHVLKHSLLFFPCHALARIPHY